MKKRIIPALLALAMVLTMLPLAAFADGVGDTVKVSTEGTWDISGDVNIFTASGKISLVQSGTDGIDGNNSYLYGYYPSINLGATTDADYVIISRGQNTSGLDVDYLNGILEKITEGTQLPYTPTADSGSHTNATWCQVYAAGSGENGWDAVNGTYWPNVSNAPVMQIAVATENTDNDTKGDKPYNYVLYQFDFSACEIDLPFQVEAPTGEVLGKQASDFQADITATTAATTLTEKKMSVTGKCVWVEEPWTEAGFADETGNYVALEIVPTNDFTGKFSKVMIVGTDETEKELDDDNIVLWQFNEAHDNTYIGVKITFGDDQGHTGSTITYTLDVSGVTAAAPDDTDPETGALSFSAVPAETSIFGKKPADMGEFEYADSDDGKTITVTGKSNYIDYPDFNANEADHEAEGNYLPIQIRGEKGTVVTVINTSVGAAAPDGKQITIGDDGTIELAAIITKNTDKEFTVSVGADDAKVIYTVDFSGVTLAPKAATGTDVEVDADQGTTATNDGNKAEVPADVDLTGTVIEVKPATETGTELGNAVAEKASQADEAVKEILKKATKAVEVTVKTIVDGEVTDEKFADSIPGGKQITITISGLEAGKTYQIFGIKTVGIVSNYGYKTLGVGETTITFKTSHLTTFVPVEVPTDADEKAAFDEALAGVTKEKDTELEGADETPVAAQYTIKFEAGTDATGTMENQTQAKAENGATTYAIPASTFTAPTGKKFDKWTLKAPVDGVTLEGDTLTIADTVDTAAEIVLVATWKIDAQPLAVTAAATPNTLGYRVSFTGQAGKVYTIQVTKGGSSTVFTAEKVGTVDFYTYADSTILVIESNQLIPFAENGTPVTTGITISGVGNASTAAN